MASLRALFLGAAFTALVACGGSSDDATTTTGAGGGVASSSSSTSTTTSSSTSTSTSTSSSGAPQHLDVLFLGNSFTFRNDLPGEFEAMVVSSGNPDVMVDSVTLSGGVLADIQADAKARIAQGGFTHVVVQGGSSEPLIDPATFEVIAASLVADAKAIGATPVLFETWARELGSDDYVNAWSGGDPAAMTAKLRAEYDKVAMQSGADVAPVGDAFQVAIAKHPEIELYDPDKRHPSVAGTYLAASVFFATITSASPVGIADHPTEITDAEASALQSVADETVKAQ
jgi:hypothetical protein